MATDNATDITYKSARLNGNLNNLGTALLVAISFEWGTTPGNLTQQTIPQVMNSTGNFSAGICSLSSNTIYYFRAKAVGDGTG